MLTIWGRENSNNVRKVLWCAAELGLSYTHINAGGAFGKVNEESYRALNPNGRCRCCRTMTSCCGSPTPSCATAAKFGDATFYPQDLQARAAAEKWMDWTTSTIVPAFTIVFWGLIRTAPELRDMAKIEAAIATLEKHFDVIEQALAHQPYLSVTTPRLSAACRPARPSADTGSHPARCVPRECARRDRPATAPPPPPCRLPASGESAPLRQRADEQRVPPGEALPVIKRHAAEAGRNPPIVQRLFGAGHPFPGPPGSAGRNN